MYFLPKMIFFPLASARNLMGQVIWDQVIQFLGLRLSQLLRWFVIGLQLVPGLVQIWLILLLRVSLFQTFVILPMNGGLYHLLLLFYLPPLNSQIMSGKSNPALGFFLSGILSSFPSWLHYFAALLPFTDIFLYSVQFF